VQLPPGISQFATACVATIAAACALEPFARRVGWLDRPRGRKAHASATPLTGGLAIVLGVLAACAVDPSLPPLLRGLGAGALVVLVAGIGDDLLDLPWPCRLALQAAAVLAMVHVGGFAWPGAAGAGLWLAPACLVAAVGVLNAFNMADGGDGIAATIALAALALFCIAGLPAANAAVAPAVLALAGAVAGFFVLNMRFAWRAQARVFLGDAGSNLLGLGLVWVALQATQPRTLALDAALAPWFVAPPLADAAATILRRVRRGRSPFRADREHLHHLLLDAGVAPARVAWLLGAATFTLGTLALAAARLGAPPPALLAAFALLVAAHAALTDDRERFVARVRRRGSPLGGETGAR